MAKKAPRRTAERILESSLALFNRFGEPNVSTTAIAADLHISAGNLYYHYPAKDLCPAERTFPSIICIPQRDHQFSMNSMSIHFRALFLGK